MSTRESESKPQQSADFVATVFVSSVNGFTARCETLMAAEIAVWINGFHRQVTDVVLAEGGMPLKYVGDGFVAYCEGADNELRAARAAGAARISSTAEPGGGRRAGPRPGAWTRDPPPAPAQDPGPPTP